MRGFDAVFLDIDNTLYDLEASIHATLEAVHRDLEPELGPSFGPFEAAYWGASNAIRDAEGMIRRDLDGWRRLCMGGALERMGIDAGADGLVDRMVRSFNTNRWLGVRAFPGVVEAVERIARDRTVGVITNGPGALQRAKLKAMGLTPRFDDRLILVSGEFGADKPDPSIFREAASRAGFEPARCLMVGDSVVHDMPAAGIGMGTVLVNAKRLPVPALSPAPHAVVETPAELPALLAR